MQRNPSEHSSVARSLPSYATRSPSFFPEHMMPPEVFSDAGGGGLVEQRQRNDNLPALGSVSGDATSLPLSSPPDYRSRLSPLSMRPTSAGEGMRSYPVSPNVGGALGLHRASSFSPSHVGTGSDVSSPGTRDIRGHDLATIYQRSPSTATASTGETRTHAYQPAPQQVEPLPITSNHVSIVRANPAFIKERRFFRWTYRAGEGSIRGKFAVDPHAQLPATLLAPLQAPVTSRANVDLKMVHGVIDVEIFLLDHVPSANEPETQLTVTTINMQVTGCKPKLAHSTRFLGARIRGANRPRVPLMITVVNYSSCGATCSCVKKTGPKAVNEQIRIRKDGCNCNERYSGDISLSLPVSFHGSVNLHFPLSEFREPVVSSTFHAGSTVVTETTSLRRYFYSPTKDDYELDQVDITVGRHGLIWLGIEGDQFYAY